MTSRSESSKRLRRRPRDLYKDELVAIVDRLVHVLHGVPDEAGEVPADHVLDDSALADLHRVLADYGVRHSPNPPIEFELELLRTTHNEPLGEVAKAKIRAAYEWPCDRTWHAAHAVVITPNGNTLWGVVLELDTTFPTRKPTGRHGAKRPAWPRVPGSALVRKALIHAIATAPVLDGRDDPDHSYDYEGDDDEEIDEIG